MSVNILERKYLKLSYRLGTDIPYYIVGNLVVAHIHKPLCKCTDKYYRYHCLNYCSYSCKINKPLVDYEVNGITCKYRHIQCTCYRHCCKQY